MSDLGVKLVEWGIILWELLELLLYIVGVYVEALFTWIFPHSLKSLVGERILITGSGNGIGREICYLLADSGATLFCLDIDKEGNKETVQNLRDGGAKAYEYEIDVSDRSQIELVSAKIKKEFGDITMIINNAAIMPCHTLLGHNPREIERVFEVNVFAHFWILREFLPNMIKSNRGHIVTVCSAAGIIATRNMVPYCATKHAVHGYVEALKDELLHMPEKPDIKFTTVYPFSTNTGLINGVKCFSRFPSIFPVLQPQDVARKLVDGILRNTEHVHVPAMIQYVGNHAKMLHPKVQRAAADFVDCHIEPIQNIK